MTINKFGHGMSYTQLEENDTALCLQKLTSGLNERVVLPASIKSHVFTTLAWVNIDRIEEILSGKGTSHRVNGIAVQPKVFGPGPPPDDLPHIDKLKQRTLSTEYQSQLDVYVAGSRVGPHPLKTKDDYVCEANKAARSAHQKNMLWILARLANSEDQKIPSWTGFNIQTRDQVQVTPDVVQYLPTIMPQQQNYQQCLRSLTNQRKSERNCVYQQLSLSWIKHFTRKQPKLHGSNTSFRTLF